MWINRWCSLSLRQRRIHKCYGWVEKWKKIGQTTVLYFTIHPEPIKTTGTFLPDVPPPGRVYREIWLHGWVYTIINLKWMEGVSLKPRQSQSQLLTQLNAQALFKLILKLATLSQIEGASCFPTVYNINDHYVHDLQSPVNCNFTYPCNIRGSICSSHKVKYM